MKKTETDSIIEYQKKMFDNLFGKNKNKEKSCFQKNIDRVYSDASLLRGKNWDDIKKYLNGFESSIKKID